METVRRIVPILAELLVLGLYLFGVMHYTFHQYDKAACEFIVGLIVQLKSQRDQDKLELKNALK